MLEPLSQRLVVLRSGIDEPLRVDRCLTTVVGHNRQIELGRADRHSTADTGKVDDGPHPVVLVRLSVDVRVILRFRKPTLHRHALIVLPLVRRRPAVSARCPVIRLCPGARTVSLILSCNSRTAVRTGRRLPATKTCPFVVVQSIYGFGLWTTWWWELELVDWRRRAPRTRATNWRRGNVRRRVQGPPPGERSATVHPSAAHCVGRPSTRQSVAPARIAQSCLDHGICHSLILSCVRQCLPLNFARQWRYPERRMSVMW